eukprot:scaffold48628_cov264-Isochrysis_galbana.AAC.1
MCHFRVDCYKKYEPILPIWDVFDENATRKALARAGACITRSTNASNATGRAAKVYVNSGHVQRLATPIAASKLEQLAMAKLLVRADGRPLRRMHFGGESDCC